MKSGPARTRIVIKSATETKDKFGAPIWTWSTTVITCYAEAIFSGGGEAINTAREVTQADIVFRTRYRSNITTKMRVEMGSRIFDIIRIDDPRGRHDTIEIYGRETV